MVCSPPESATRSFNFGVSVYPASRSLPASPFARSQSVALSPGRISRGSPPRVAFQLAGKVQRSFTAGRDVGFLY